MENEKKLINNLEIEVIQYKKINWATFLYVLYLFMMLSFLIVFSYIVLSNTSFATYQHNIKNFENRYGKNLTPSRNLVVGLIYVSILFSLVGFFSFAIVPFILKSKKIIKWKKIIIILSQFILITLSMVFFSASEYLYSRYNLLCHIIENLQKTSLVEDDKWSKEILLNYSLDPKKWASSTSVWWLFFIKITLCIFCFMSYESTINLAGKYAEKVFITTRVNVKKENIGLSKISKFYNNIFVTSEKGVALWMILVTTIILIPQLVYSIKLSESDKDIRVLFNYTEYVQYLTKNCSSWENFRSAVSKLHYINYFAAKELPIIFIGVSCGTTLLFLSIVSKQWRVNSNILIFQISVSFFEITGALVSSAYSKGQLNYLITNWNDKGIYEMIVSLKYQSKMQINYNDISKIFGIVKVDKMNQIPFMWLNGVEYISEVIISFMFLLSTYIIFFKKIFVILKLRKQKFIESIQSKRIEENIDASLAKK